MALKAMDAHLVQAAMKANGATKMHHPDRANLGVCQQSRVAGDEPINLKSMT